MKQERRITYQAGITRTPSDFLCKDGELAECVGLATDHEELKPVVEPKLKFTTERSNGKVFIILYVHRQDGEARYIGYWKGSNVATSPMTWGTENDSHDGLGIVTDATNNMSPFYFNYDASKNTKVTSMGSILIISNDDKTCYYLWKADVYRTTALPLPDLTFSASLFATDKVGCNSGSADGEVFRPVDDDNYDLPAAWRNLTVNEKNQEKFNDLVTGLYAKNLKEIAEEKMFCQPFFVRAALEMLDGSYIYVTNPILLFPSVRMNTCAYIKSEEDTGDCLFVQTYASLLYLRQKTDFSGYSDIVKDVVVFASRPVNIYNTETDQPCEGITGMIYRRPESTSTWPTYADSVEWMDDSDDPTGECSYHEIAVPETKVYDDPMHFYSWYATVYQVLKQRDDEDIMNDLKSTSVFYRICSLGLKPTGGWVDARTKISDNTLPNLTALSQLKYDDYYSRSKMTASMLYAYNSRLNMAGVKRGLFEGFDFFMPLYSEETEFYNFYVKIKMGLGTEKWVMHRAPCSEKQGIYFFYPDPRATHVTIWKKVVDNRHDLASCVCDVDLTEHQMLNGAYYMKELPNSNTDETTVYVSSKGFHIDPWTDGSDDHNADEYDNNYMEPLTNYIVQSEVDNPWVFRALGYNRVGTGRIIGMAANTHALSQGQFGYAPLIVFSEEGLWAMSVDKTGLYASLDPMPREVCVNPKSITQTDDAVFFASKKGLMMIVGRDVVCVSEMLNGIPAVATSMPRLETQTISGQTSPAYDWRNEIKAGNDNRAFADIISADNCVIAYDYRDSRLLIISPSGASGTVGFAYVYNMASGSFTKILTGCTSVVNDYPDTLLQGVFTENVGGVSKTRTKVYSLYGKDLETSVEDRQTAFLLTRPMKLAGPVAVASIRELVNVGLWKKKDSQGNELSCVKTEVWQSDDLYSWYPAESRFGASAKYFRIALYIKMLPTERLSGTIIMEQERRTDNQRA